MSHPQGLRWSIAVTLMMLLLSGCGRATPTPIVIVPVAAATEAPPLPIPLPATVRATDVPPTTAPEETTPDLTGTVEETGTPGTPAATANPLDQPFLMRIDRVSVVVGRGTLLEGRVAHGTLQTSGIVDILGPQGKTISTPVLALLISNIPRDQVTVGDYARILVQSMEANQMSPGMLLAAAGAFETYEEALQAIQ